MNGLRIQVAEDAKAELTGLVNALLGRGDLVTLRAPDVVAIAHNALRAVERLESALMQCASEHARPGSVRCQWCGEFTGTQPDPAAAARYLAMLGKA